MRRGLYIFDLDGTLADTRHRQRFLEGDTRDWRAFFAACTGDTPIVPVIATLQALQAAGCDVEIWSGRSTEVVYETGQWLKQHVGLAGIKVRMREEGDFTPDHILKREWLDAMPDADRARLVAVFDDRDSVVAMWRSAGVPCFQVAPGAF